MTVMSEIVEERDIIQVKPDARRWAGCLVVVTEVRSWGITGYMQFPGPCDGIVVVVDTGRAFVRLEWAEFTLTGGKVLR